MKAAKTVDLPKVIQLDLEEQAWDLDLGGCVVFSSLWAHCIGQAGCSF